MDIFIRGEWSAEVKDSLLEEWGIGRRTIETYITAARYHVSRLGDQDLVLERIRKHLDDWMDESNPKDRVAAARLMAESYGILKQKVDINVSLSQNEVEAQVKLIYQALRSLDEVMIRALERTLEEPSNNRLKTTLKRLGWQPQANILTEGEGQDE